MTLKELRLSKELTQSEFEGRTYDNYNYWI